MPFPEQVMSTLSAHFHQATNLFISGPYDVDDPVVVVNDRPITDDGGVVVVLVNNGCLQDVPVFDGWKV